MSGELEAFDYQTEGSGYLVDGTSQMLGWEPGLGKTLGAILACDKLRAKNILVLCNAIGKSHWAREFKRTQEITRPITVVDTVLRDPILVAAPVNIGVVIVNYDLISRSDGLTRDALMARQWDVLVCDEAHALKTTSSNRTKAVYGPRVNKIGGLAARATHVWLLTGTPALSHAGELYTHLRALAPNTILLNNHVMNESEFIDRFCTYRVTRFGRHITGSYNIEELRRRMGRFIHRLRKKDVLTSLPPLRFDTLPVHIRDVPDLPPDLLLQLNAAEAALSAVLASADAGSANSKDDELLGILASLRTNTHLATQRRLTGRIKAEIAINLVHDELAARGGKKIIVFAHHIEVIDRIVNGLSSPKRPNFVVKIDGRDSAAARDASILAFQTDPRTRVFVGQIQAAGTSITLTAASDVLFVEADWVPSNNLQAACRAHRIGQKDGVLARYLALDGSIDASIMSALARKSRDLAALIDNETTEQDDKAVPA